MAKIPTKGGRASMNHRSTDGSDAPAEVERITMEDHMLKQEVGCWVLQVVTFFGMVKMLSDPFLRGWKGDLQRLGMKRSRIESPGCWHFFFCKGYEHENWHVFFEAKLSGWTYAELFVEVMLNELVLVLGDSKSSFLPYTEIHTVMKTGNILENEYFEPNNGGGWNMIFNF